jgi:hypothetical protein
VGLFSRFRANPTSDSSGENTQPEGTQRVGKAAHMAYDPALTGRLRDGQRELLRTYAAVRAAAGEHRFHDIGRLLAHFKQTFQTHVATENMRFYAYVQQRVARDKEAYAVIADARREMNALDFGVLKVVDAYIAYPPTYLTETQFKFDLEQAGAQLAQRIDQAEKTLYPLYGP